MGFRIGALGWKPMLDVLGDQLGRKLGVAFLVKSFSFLASFVLTKAVYQFRGCGVGSIVQS